jgi:hypothetical protein
MDDKGAAETFWERCLTNYRFYRLFGEGRWHSFWRAIRAAWMNESGPF